MSDQPKNLRTLLIAELRPYDAHRLQWIIPEFTQRLRAMTGESPELAFRSASGDIFGLFLSGRLKPAQYIARLQSPGRGPIGGDQPFLTNSDHLFGIKLGLDSHATEGFTRANTWLQRH